MKIKKSYKAPEHLKSYVDKKIKFNKSYLEKLTYFDESYNLKSMLDTDMNANISPERYFAEVNNRVNTLHTYSKELGLVPAFLTITVPSEYHPKSKKYEGYTPRESALHISKIWSKFLRLKLFKNMKDDGHNKIYIRVYEPHVSGVPHLHAMVFVPPEYLAVLKAKFFEHFTKYGFHKKHGLKYIDDFTHSKYKDGRGAIAYIIKYMNKTFRHAKDDKMTDEAYYFAYHGIRRFITSQTLIPLWMYRKIKGNEDTRDLLSLTKQYKDGNIYSCFDKEYIMQRYVKKEKIVYDIDDVEINSSVEEKIIFQKNHFISDQFKTSQVVRESTPKTWTKKIRPIPTYLNGEIISHYYKGIDVPFIKHITELKDLELYKLHDNYDLELGTGLYYINTHEEVKQNSYVKYLAIKNLMIDRNLMKGEKYNLDSFDMNEFLHIDEKYYHKSYNWYSAEMIGVC